MHLIRSLGIAVNLMVDPPTSVLSRESKLGNILAACLNVDTLFCDVSVDLVTRLLLDNPNITRLSFAGDNVSEDPILTWGQEGFRNLTHIWVHDLRYFWSAVVHDGFTVAPRVFSNLTHVAAGSDLEVSGCEDQIARAVREVLRFNQLQRFLLLVPVDEGQEPRIDEKTPLWHSLVALRDPRVYVIATPYPREFMWKKFVPIWQWHALNDMRADAITWESGTSVWSGECDATKEHRAVNFDYSTLGTRIGS